MNKNLIIRYLKGLCDESQKQRILNWIEKSDENRRYFAALQDLWLASNMPQERASDSQMSIADKIIVQSGKSESITTEVEKQATVGEIVNTTKRNRIDFKYIVSYGVAAIAIIALVLNISINNAQKKAKEGEIERYYLAEVPKEYKHTIYTNKGVKGEAILPDGSHVWLNSDSRITFPDTFAGDTREVEIAGEVYFNVVSNPEIPMIVSTNRNFSVEVYGTQFIIRSYSNEDNATTLLLKGKISLRTYDANGETKDLKELLPNESCTIMDYTAPVFVAVADTVKQTAWTRGVLVFDKTPMDAVLRELERWHGAEFVVEDPTIYDLKFSANFKEESLVQILETIKFCSSVDYSIDNNRVTLFRQTRNYPS